MVEQMGLWQRISSLFRSNGADPFDVASARGNQQIVDPRLMLTSQVFYAPFRREDRIPLFYSLYYNSPIFQGAVNVICKMCVTEPIFRSGDPDVDALCKDIWRQIGGRQVTDQLMRQGCIYGYAAGEIVTDDEMTTVQRVVVPDSPLIRFVPNKQGVITDVRQLIGTVFSSQANNERGAIPAGKFIIYRRDPVSAFDYYGSSLAESCLAMFDNLCAILDAEVAVMLRLGKPRWVVRIPSDGVSPEMFHDRLAKMRAIMEQWGNSKYEDVIVPEGVDISILGADGFGQRYTEEVRSIVSCILAGLGIPPSLLHVTIQGSGGAETWVRQSTIALMSIFDAIQEGICEAWNTTFWTTVAAMYNLPVVPRMSLTRPRLLERIQEATGAEKEFNNALREVIFGIRPPEYLAQIVDAPDIDDPEALQDMIVKARETYSLPKETATDETSQSVSTKDTDENKTNDNNP